VTCQSLGVYLIHGGSATRKDPVVAQQENVRTLIDLERQVRGFPTEVRRGVGQRMQSARYNLGCALSKSGRHLAAFKAVLPTLIGRPSWRSLRDALSMLKG
jgi:hypothetical protein